MYRILVVSQFTATLDPWTRWELGAWTPSSGRTYACDFRRPAPAKKTFTTNSLLLTLLLLCIIHCVLTIQWARENTMWLNCKKIAFAGLDCITETNLYVVGTHTIQTRIGQGSVIRIQRWRKNFDNCLKTLHSSTFYIRFGYQCQDIKLIPWGIFVGCRVREFGARDHHCFLKCFCFFTDFICSF